MTLPTSSSGNDLQRLARLAEFSPHRTPIGPPGATTSASSSSAAAAASSSHSMQPQPRTPAPPPGTPTAAPPTATSATTPAPAPAWSNLPADVLSRVLHLLPPDHTPRLLATCISWNACIKAHLAALAPFCLGTPQALAKHPPPPPPFPHVTSIAAPLTRTHLHPVARYAAPLRSLAPLTLFPALTALDISGQPVALPPANDPLLAPLRRLASLTLDECEIAPALLLAILSPASRLTHLSLAGIRLPAPPAPPAPAPPPPPPHASLLAAIGRLPRLASLNLSARTALIQKHTASFASFQHTTTCLPLLHHAHLLAPLAPTLTSLTLSSNRLSAPDLPPLATLTRLASLSLSFLLNDHSLALSTSALFTLAPLAPSLTSLSLRLHGTSREEGTLAHLPALRSLTLTGCHNVILALSATALTLLTHLDLSESGAAISHDLILHLAASLPALVSLTLDRIKCTSDFELPADAITRGLLAAAPHLHALHLDGVPLHGTGLSAPPPVPPAPTPPPPPPGGAIAPAPPFAPPFMLDPQASQPLPPPPMPAYPPRRSPNSSPFPHLTSLTVSAEALLRARYHDIATLTSLRSLTLTSYPRNELEVATRHGCLTPLTALTNLTSLTLAPPSTRVHAATPTREPLLAFLSPLTGLRALSLGPVSSHGHFFAYVMPLTNLRTLHLTGCLSPSPSGLATLAALPPLPSLATLHLNCLHWPAPPAAAPSTSRAKAPPNPPSPADLCAALLATLPRLFPSLGFLAIGSLAPALPQHLRPALEPLTTLRHLVLHTAPQMNPPVLLCLLSPLTHLQTLEVTRHSSGEASRGMATAWARYGAELVPV